jgi:hypothetical protein
MSSLTGLAYERNIFPGTDVPGYELSRLSALNEIA